MRKPDIRRKSYQLERNPYHAAHSEMQRAILNGNDKQDNNSAARPSAAGTPWRALMHYWASRGLPTKLLLLTAMFVVIAETLIFLPAVANFRVAWLQERLTAAQLAALASDAFPGGQVPSALHADLLRTAAVRAIASRREGERRLVLPAQGDLVIDYVYYLQPEPDLFWEGLGLRFEQVKDAIATLFADNGRIIRVAGHAGTDNGDLTSLARPFDQLLRIFEHLRRHLEVRHRVERLVLEGAKRFHAARGVVGTVRVIDLEIQHIVIDQPEEEPVAVEAHPAEHATRHYGTHRGELLEDVGVKVVGDWHLPASCLSRR